MKTAKLQCKENDIFSLHGAKLDNPGGRSASITRWVFSNALGNWQVKRPLDIEVTNVRIT